MLLRLLLIGCVLYAATLQVVAASTKTSYDGNIQLIVIMMSCYIIGIIRPTGDGRYEAYMIPPKKSNHASFLERLSSGDFVMAWFSGEEEGASNCSIAVALLASNSSQWSRGRVVSWRVGYSDQNPVLFQDITTGILHLFHSQQPANGVVKRQVCTSVVLLCGRQGD